MSQAIGLYGEYPLLSDALARCLARAAELGVYAEPWFEALPHPLPLPEEALAGLAGEIIDCAINSCLQIEEPAARWISPRLSTKKAELHLECTAPGVPGSSDALEARAKAFGGCLRVERYGDSYCLQAVFRRNLIIIIDPVPKAAAELATMLRGALCGQTQIKRYHTPGACPPEELALCRALFITLGSVDDVVRAYALRPADKRWPLAVVADHDRFGLEAYALSAKAFLLRPMTAEQAAEALQKCFCDDD